MPTCTLKNKNSKGVIVVFGKSMMIELNKNSIIELKPFEREEIANKRICTMLADYEVSQYLNMVTSPTIEDEGDWWDKTRRNEKSIVWGIYLDDSQLLGVTSLHIISANHSASSGFMLFDKRYWRKGLASTSHIARTFYGNHILNLKTIQSSVYSPNVGSWRALKSVGYFETGNIWGATFIRGAWREQKNLQWISPEHTEIFFANGIW
jgi:RimJ/RimL family protein N-acetyltransferase